jgi:hypothetical protein
MNIKKVSGPETGISPRPKIKTSKKTSTAQFDVTLKKLLKSEKVKKMSALPGDEMSPQKLA